MQWVVATASFLASAVEFVEAFTFTPQQELSMYPSSNIAQLGFPSILPM